MMPQKVAEGKASSNEGYLEGQLLIATPLIQGSCFQKSVIYVCAHNAEGAMGIILNQPLAQIDFVEILRQLGIDTPHVARKFPLHFGGPVEPARGFVLHTDEYKRDETVLFPAGLALTSSLDVLKDIAEGEGPKKGLLALGYSGWSAGQLEQEIEANSWISVPATPWLVFDTDMDSKWMLAARSQGIDLSKLSGEVGHA